MSKAVHGSKFLGYASTLFNFIDTGLTADTPLATSAGKYIGALNIFFLCP